MNVTKKQLRVLEMLSAGRLYKEIADAMGISFSAVRVHVYALLRKFKADNPTVLIVSFVRLQSCQKVHVNSASYRGKRSLRHSLPK